MSVNISVTGGDGLRRALEQYQSTVYQEFTKALTMEAEEIAQDAQSRVRVDSGDLKGSISAEVSKHLRANVRPRSELSRESGQDHGIKANVNEFGRKSDPGQPYMTPAAEASRRRWPNRAKKALKNATG